MPDLPHILKLQNDVNRIAGIQDSRPVLHFIAHRSETDIWIHLNSINVFHEKTNATATLCNHWACGRFHSKKLSKTGCYSILFSLFIFIHFVKFSVEMKNILLRILLNKIAAGCLFHGKKMLFRLTVFDTLQLFQDLSCFLGMTHLFQLSCLQLYLPFQGALLIDTHFIYFRKGIL